MIIKFTEENNSKYFKIYDIKNNEIKDEKVLFLIKKILCSIQFILELVDKNLTGYNVIDLDIYSIKGKIYICEETLKKVGFYLTFKEVNQEETIMI